MNNEYHWMPCNPLRLLGRSWSKIEALVVVVVFAYRHCSLYFVSRVE